MRLLITGVSGFLGAALAEAAQSTPGWQTTGSYFSHAPRAARCPLVQLDLRDATAVRATLAALQADSVIHTACSNRDEDNLNGILPAAENLATACRAHNARLVHVSTDLVFGGSPLTENVTALLKPFTGLTVIV